MHSSPGTQGAVSDSLPTLWQDYDIISGITKVIKEKQGTSPFPMSDRKEKMAQFEKWLAENGAIYTDRVCVCVCVWCMCVCVCVCVRLCAIFSAEVRIMDSTLLCSTSMLYVQLFISFTSTLHSEIVFIYYFFYVTLFVCLIIPGGD